ncbi:MAG: COX15/CtaA family protein, partial [Alphaproteobacteria bacterium]|nr:COX15/CtaA family protein [Alphaproteobacteria bacterium]
WYMVASGLKDDPRVSHFRLALHLSTAFLIFGLLFWQWMRFSGWGRASTAVGGWLWALMAALCAQIVLGAFVAGLDAGLVYNTFPLMDGGWAPPELEKGLSLHEPGTVQWLHRLGAGAVFLLAAAFGLIRVKAEGAALRHYGAMFLLLVLAQAGLGIVTLLYAVPVSLASLHQVAALFLFGFLLSGIYRFTQTPPGVKSVPDGDVHASLTRTL